MTSAPKSTVQAKKSAASAAAPAKKPVAAASAVSAPAKVEKKSKVAKPKVAKSASAPASHPPFKQMVRKAIAELKEKSGSSRQAILKYICGTYKVEAKSGTKYVKLALVSGVKAGSIKRVAARGVGANGSFRLAESEASNKVVKVKTVKKVGIVEFLISVQFKKLNFNGAKI